MAFIVEPIADEWSSVATMNLKGLLIREHTESYRIKSDTFVPPIVAEGSLGFSSFAIYGPDPSARLRSVQTTLDKGKQTPWVYLSTAKWSTETPEAGQQNREEDNPLDDDPEIDLDGETILYPMFKDLNNNIITNTALAPLKGVEEERAIEVLTITRNEATRNSVRDRLYRNSVNSDTWSGAAPGTIKMRSIRSSRQYRNGILFWRYIFVIAYNDKGWQPKVLNEGLMQRISNGSGGYKTVPCLDDNNEPVRGAVPLENSGAQLDPDTLPSSAVYLTFTTLPQNPFAAPRTAVQLAIIETGTTTESAKNCRSSKQCDNYSDPGKASEPMLGPLKQAVVKDGSRYQAGVKAREYRAAFEKTHDSRYRELAHVHEYLQRGKTLISINKAMQVAGVKPDGSPVLAIANAAAKWAWFSYDGGSVLQDDESHLMASFVSDFRVNPRWKKSGPNKPTWGTHFKFDRSFFPVRPSGELKARVPTIPPRHMPRGDLKNYAILWEANWTAAPVDPLLLKRISRDFFVVIAEWDLTEIERLVIEMSTFSG